MGSLYLLRSNQLFTLLHYRDSLPGALRFGLATTHDQFRLAISSQYDNRPHFTYKLTTRNGQSTYHKRKLHQEKSERKVMASIYLDPEVCYSTDPPIPSLPVTALRLSEATATLGNEGRPPMDGIKHLLLYDRLHTC